jgi:hypothetical protein
MPPLPHHWAYGSVPRRFGGLSTRQLFHGKQTQTLTRRHRGVSLEKTIADLNPFVRGWAGYFGLSQWHELPSLDGWIRRRRRCVAWV